MLSAKGERAMNRKPSAPPEAAQVCVVYCRVSSQKQAAEDKGSLDAQEANGLAKAAELGLRVLYVVKDPESAWILDKRTKFWRVSDDGRAGKFSVMVIDRMDRLTRSENIGEFMQVMTELRLAGVKPVFVDKDYGSSPFGEVMQVIDAYGSSLAQAARRAQSLQGKRTRVLRDHHPNPGPRARYGYRWGDATKTRLEKSGDEAQATVERIWREFLGGDRTTLRGVRERLIADGVRPPRVYQGINDPRSRNRWSIETIRQILHDPVYWGGPVTTFNESKHNDPVEIPVYAPAYVTPTEAARVHARFGANFRSAARNRKRDWGTLLNGGIGYCGCGWRLEVHPNSRDRKDGSRLLLYRCQQANQHGRGVCPGGSISTQALDYAVRKTLDEHLGRHQFLENVFAAWDREAEATTASIRALETTLATTRAEISNGAARLTRWAADDPLSAPLEAHLRMLAEAVPGLEEKLRKARDAANTARNNPALRDELYMWFDAWMSGFWELPLEEQRDFLFAIHARVVLWPEGAHQPRVELHIELPVAGAGQLPPAPVILEVPDAAITVGGMDLRGFGFLDDTDPYPAPRPKPRAEQTAEEAMAEIRDELEDRFLADRPRLDDDDLPAAGGPPVMPGPRRPRTGAAAGRSRSRAPRGCPSRSGSAPRARADPPGRSA